MNTLIFATANSHKLNEIRNILPQYSVLGLRDIGITTDIPETGSTLEENAILKAEFLYLKNGQPSLAEDTGLEVRALAGLPGVHTARYAGEGKDMESNMNLLLNNLEKQIDRNAQFRTVIAYVSSKETRIFEGIIKGRIAYKKSGYGGFGYDPIFIPDGYDKTFAELNQEIKNNISHRANALKLLVSFLEGQKF